MALDVNAYGSADEVAALARRYLGGETTFNINTTPTLDQVEDFLNRASGVLNLALAGAGFAVPVTQADAKRACDEWAVQVAAEMVEWTYPASRGRREPGDNPMNGLQDRATDFVKANAAGFANLGVSLSNPASAAMLFTAETAQADRDDPADTGLEQPMFTRRRFDS